MKTTTLKKQTIMIIALTAAAVIMIILYSIIAHFISGKEEEIEIPELINEGDIHGEVLGANNRIQIFEKVSKENLQNIEVHNSYGTYTFYRGTDGEIYIKDHEASPYSLQMLSSMITSAGYALSMSRVTMDCEDMSIYGLGEGEEQGSYTITTTAGIEHTVYIGDLIPTGAGYYVRYDGRNAVYILDATLSITLLNSINAFITPILTYPTSENDYYSITDFILKRNNEVLVHINRLDDEEKTAHAAISTFEMVEPGDYVPSSTTYETSLLPKLADFEGTGVLVLGTVSESISEEVLLEHGIDLNNAAYYLHYVYNGINNDVFFSEYIEEGDCYNAYSVLFNTIVQISASTVDFLAWDFIEYVDRSIFLMFIDNIETIEINSGSVNETFILSGEDKELVVTRQKTGDVIDTKNFRKLYQVMLSLKLQGYAPYTDETLDQLTTVSDTVQMKVTTRAGIVYDYVFYPYHTGRAFYTINGNGEFYVLRDSLAKLISDTQKVVAGETVDPQAKN